MWLSGKRYIKRQSKLGLIWRDHPVAGSEAHNLEVVGSSPTPATRKESHRVNCDPAMNLYKGIKEE